MANTIYWHENSLSSRFSKTEKSFFLRPRPEANASNLWHLRKCFYRLADSPQRILPLLRDELTNLNMETCSKVSFPMLKMVYYLEFSYATWMISCLKEPNNAVRNLSIPSLKNTFEIGRASSSSFVYIGTSLKQLSDYACLFVCFSHFLPLKQIGWLRSIY